MQITPKDVFIVVDAQIDFVSGTMAIPGAQEIISPINRTAAIFDHVVVVTDWHPAGHVSFSSSHPGTKHGDSVDAAYGKQGVFNDHCVQGTQGAELAPGLELGKAEMIFRKGYREGVDSFGAFYENDETPTGLGAYLKARGFERVFCAGLARYGCVMQTALGAARDGFEAFIVLDASAGDRNVEENNKKLSEAGVTWSSSGDLMTSAAA
jgi:nicotinamidase/pyrazinamidase